MANVTTYKCDICGEIYQVDENYKDFMNIIHNRKVEGEIKYDCFTDICPGCARTIGKCIKNPRIIDELHYKISEISSFKHSLAHYIDRLKPMLDTPLRDSLVYADCSKLNTYDRIITGANDSYNKMKDACTYWRLVAVGAICALCVVLICMGF